MRAVAAIVILLLILIGLNSSITGNVIAGESNEAPSIFGKIWDFFKGLFMREEEITISSANATARVALEISPDYLNGL